MKSEFEYAMESLDNIAKNLSIGCQQEISNQIWNAMEQAKAAYHQRPTAKCGEAKLLEALLEARKDIHNFHRDYVHYEGGKVDKELNRIWNELNKVIMEQI